MSEQIKPWTHRRQKSPTLLSPNKNKQAELVLKDRPIIKNRIISLSDMKQTIQKPTDLPLLQPQASIRARRMINQKLAQNLRNQLSMSQQKQFLPNFKLINISFGNRSPKRAKKDRLIPYHISSLKQYTENHDIRNQKNSQNKFDVSKATKIRRYFTQQKYENTNNSGQASTQMESSLTKANQEKPQAQSRNNPSLKLISSKYRSIQQSEKLIRKGKLYEEIDKLCNIKPIKSSKLTFMKRTYNLKRLEKILP